MALLTSSFEFRVDNLVVRTELAVQEQTNEFCREGYKVRIFIPYEDEPEYVYMPSVSGPSEDYLEEEHVDPNVTFDESFPEEHQEPVMTVNHFWVDVTAESPISAADFEHIHVPIRGGRGKKTVLKLKKDNPDVRAKGIEHLRTTLDVAKSVASEFVDWVRIQRAQVWLGLHGECPQLVSSKLEEGQLLLPICLPLEHLSPSPPADAAIDEPYMESVIKLLADPPRYPPAEETLLADALYSVAFMPRDLQRAVLVAAIACEVKVKAKLQSTVVQKRMGVASLFDKPLKTARGHSLREENRNLYKRVVNLYEVRNRIAHRGEHPSAHTAGDVVGAAGEAFKWLDGICS